jgi:hypothetical protein
MPYLDPMQAVLTSEFLEIVPEPVRERLKLKAGGVIDFDEQAPFLKGVPVSNGDAVDMAGFQAWLTASTGIAKGILTTDERLRETRGEE